VQDVGGGLSGLAALTSDKSTLEVCIHDDALYRSTFFTFTFTLRYVLSSGLDKLADEDSL